MRTFPVARTITAAVLTCRPTQNGRLRQRVKEKMVTHHVGAPRLIEEVLFSASELGRFPCLTEISLTNDLEDVFSEPLLLFRRWFSEVWYGCDFCSLEVLQVHAAILIHLAKVLGLLVRTDKFLFGAYWHQILTLARHDRWQIWYEICTRAPLAWNPIS